MSTLKYRVVLRNDLHGSRPEQLDDKIFHKSKEAIEWRDEVRELGWPQSYVVSYVKVEDLDEFNACQAVDGLTEKLASSFSGDELAKVLDALVEAFQKGRDSVGNWPAPVRPPESYWEVLHWREPFDPGDCFEFDHGDLSRNYFDSEDDALAAAVSLAKGRGVHVRVHEIHRRVLAIPFD
jgi:hypothetical protein